MPPPEPLKPPAWGTPVHVLCAWVLLRVGLEGLARNVYHTFCALPSRAWSTTRTTLSVRHPRGFSS